MEAERIQAHGALCSSESKKKLPAEKRWDTHFLSNKEKEKWIEHYVQRETAVARQQVEVAETAIMDEQEDRRNAEMVGLTTRKTNRIFEEMLNVIGDCVRDLGSTDNEGGGKDEEDEQDHMGQGKLSEDGKLGWVSVSNGSVFGPFLL